MGLGAAIPFIKGLAPKPIDPADVGTAVADYLEDHPEATCPIDDTAGEGDTGKVWSADKSAGEVATLSEAIVPLTPAATSVDVGKFLKAKTVSGGKVTEYEFGEGGGGSVTVDDELSDSSTNPVQNKVITKELIGFEDLVDNTLAPGITVEVNPRQLWNKALLPLFTNNSFVINTSSKLITAPYSNCYGYTIEINGKSGDVYSFNLLNSKTFANYNASTVEIFALNDYPANGGYALQRGSSSTSYYRGSITLGQNSKYICLNVVGTSSCTKENADSLMENVVVRKGTVDTTYYEYEEIVRYVSRAATFTETAKLHYGSNIIDDNAITLGTGWTGDIANGLVHATGSASDLTITIPSTANIKYLVMFNTSNPVEEKLCVSIGTGAKFDTFRGQSNVVVGIVSDSSGTVKINAASSLSTTLTSLGIYPLKYDGTGTEIEVNVSNLSNSGLPSNLTGFWNIALGPAETMAAIINGSRNIAIGSNAQYMLKQGTRNVAIGTFAMPYVKNGDRNVVIGADCLYSTSNINTDNQAFDNVAIGKATLKDGTSVKDNVAIGSHAMGDSGATAESNVAIGSLAGNYAKYRCTFVGYRAGYYTKGDYNTALGHEAGGQTYVTGQKNVSIGYGSGFDNTGGTSSVPLTMNNTITVGANVKAKATNEARFGNADNVIFLAGKKIVFNNDGTVTWTEDN